MPGKSGKSKAKVKENHNSAGVTFLLGRAIQKEFKGHGMFLGRVTDFHVETGYRVSYEDGDSEDFGEDELVCAPARRCDARSSLVDAPLPAARTRACLCVR